MLCDDLLLLNIHVGCILVQRHVRAELTLTAGTPTAHVVCSLSTIEASGMTSVQRPDSTSSGAPLQTTIQKTGNTDCAR